MIAVTVYTRQDCHLCEQVVAELETLQATVAHTVRLVDVDSDPKWQKEYGFNVPVVIIGPYKLKAPITRQDLDISLRAVQQRDRQEEKISADLAGGRIPLGITWTSADDMSYKLSKHYLAFFNLLVALYLGLAFLAPVLEKTGATLPAEALYRMYSFVCHQLPYRSWFLFGEQAYYPRAVAEIPGVLTFQQATGLSEGSEAEDIWVVRAYVGDQLVGFKVALCQRDVAIYASIVLFGLIFSAARKRPGHWLAQPLHWALWILLGIIPIGLDGGTQLLSQFLPAFNVLIPFRESTPLLRTLTGFLFGFTSAWFAYPLVEESFVDSVEIFERKRNYVRINAEAKSDAVSSTPNP